MNREKAKKVARLMVIGGLFLSVVSWLSLVSMSSASAAPVGPMVGTSVATVAAGLTTEFPEECQTTTTDDMELTTCNSGHAHSSSTASDVSVARLKFRGRVVLEFLVRGGLTRQQIGNARCFTSHRGWNTGRTSDGQIRKYWDTRDQRICRTGRGPSGWQVVKCGNFYWPQMRPPPRFRKVRNPVVVRSFNNWTLKGKIDVSAESTGTSHAEADAVCVGSSGHGSATASATAYARATLWFKFRGRTQMRAKASEVQHEFELSLHAQAYGKARTSATTEAEADAWCTSQQPPQEQPPVFLQFREFNDLEVNWTADHCVTVDFPAGHSGTVFWTAQWGSFATPTKPAQDGVQVCSTYKAPSEVPPGGTDTITVTATDNTTDKSVTKTTNPFVIHPTAPHPPRQQTTRSGA